ncbi:hypothetical protein RF11_10608 [Thelohanellus kitauei]|uniref:Uncharacterized protein n=1 Tax=Thelohanellus kitauei TaxID=669202 RepID=A0A0C2N9V3_THEKT|nr:hypothetical protein RF11_10608 [Thelohanellus kitauei]
MIKNGSSFLIEWDYLIPKESIMYSDLEISNEDDFIKVARKFNERNMVLEKKMYENYVASYEDEKVLLINIDSTFHKKMMRLKVMYCIKGDCTNIRTRNIGTIYVITHFFDFERVKHCIPLVSIFVIVTAIYIFIYKYFSHFIQQEKKENNKVE